MPIFARGYSPWDGELTGRLLRWFTIARWGVQLTSRSKWLKRMVLVAWLPLLYYIFAFFLVGQVTEVATLDRAQDMWQFQAMRGIFGSAIADEFIRDPASFRPMIWSLLIHFFMHWTQLFCVMIVVAIVGPKLVSQDLQSRALALYFSKPLTRVDYMAGKLAIVGFWVGVVTLAPTLVLYVLSILFSPSTEAFFQTVGIIPRVVAFSLFLMIGMGAPMLALSSLTPNTRFLGFLWAGFWVMSYVASKILSNTLFPRWGRDFNPADDWTGIVSFFGNFDAVGFRLFQIEALATPAAELSPRAEYWLGRYAYGHDWRWSLLIVAAIAAISLAVIAVRIGRPGEAGAK